MAIKKIKLTPKQVKAYEKSSGFKTTGKVELHITDGKTYHDTMEALYGLPKTPQP